MEMMEKTDKIIGCILGGAVGGVFMGRKELPQHLVTRLEDFSLIEGITNQFAKYVVANSAG
jgi:hypothetical protein